METKIVNEQAHFFNKQQKEVKQKIMEALMDGFFLNLHENQELFQDPQAIVDLFGSILTMFNIDIISHLLINLGMTDQGSKLMRNLFENIRSEVVKKIKLSKN